MTLKLGLIGDNIAASHAPRLHRLAGELSDTEVTYDRLVPRDEGLRFSDLFARCQANGYDGLNITYPYKADAAQLVRIADPLVRAMGAVNTILFRDGAAEGFNTDYSGFVTAIRRALEDSPVGAACLLGAGGVGKAMAFGLVALGATSIRITDLDRPRTEDLAATLKTAAPDVPVTVHDTVSEAADGAQGILNATPIGMDGYSGNPVPAECLAQGRWVFDAIYTPRETEFLQTARKAGLQTVPGYELFIHQGVDAWRLFSGIDVDEALLRQGIAD